MRNIEQDGKNHKATTGDHSPIIEGDNNRTASGENSLVDEENKILISITNKQKASWFLSGFVIPLIVGLLTEYISSGKVSEVLEFFTQWFK